MRTIDSTITIKNRRLTRRLWVVVLGMFGFGYALVPLYDVFCEWTGAGAGRVSSLVQAGTSVAAIDRERWITVELTTDIVGLPWQLELHEHKLRVRPGQATTVAYRVRNTAQTLLTGTAVPSVVPPRAARYFIKTACFCFEQQALAANETRDMPLTFVVDPKLPAEVKTITLSYSFYPATAVSS